MTFLWTSANGKLHDSYGQYYLSDIRAEDIRSAKVHMRSPLLSWTSNLCLEKCSGLESDKSMIFLQFWMIKTQPSLIAEASILTKHFRSSWGKAMECRERNHANFILKCPQLFLLPVNFFGLFFSINTCRAPTFVCKVVDNALINVSQGYKKAKLRRFQRRNGCFWKWDVRVINHNFPTLVRVGKELECICKKDLYFFMYYNRVL